MSLLSDFIRVYDSITPELLYTNTVQESKNIFASSTEPVNSLAMSMHPQLEPYRKAFLDLTKISYSLYARDLRMPTLPKDFIIEDIAISHLPEVEKIDPGSIEYSIPVFDAQSSERVICVYYFLNTVPARGGLQFPANNLVARAVQSRVVVFPASWMFPYYEIPSNSEPLFIAKTCVRFQK